MNSDDKNKVGNNMIHGNLGGQGSMQNQLLMAAL